MKRTFDHLTIMPTHRCFDDALDHLCEYVKSGASYNRGVYLVHGICKDDAGKLYAHAWTEINQRVTDFGLIDIDGKMHRVEYEVTMAEFYTGKRVQEITRYTVSAAL